MKKIVAKQLTKTDLHKLTIPMKSFPSFPQPQGHHATVFPVRDESGRVSRFGVKTRKKGPYKKPILSVGWRKFVLQKELGVGDKVSFFKEIDQATGRAQYMIKVEKPINRAISTDALVHVTKEATGKASYMIEEKNLISILEDTLDDAPFYGFDQVTDEADFQIEEKRRTIMFGIIVDGTPVQGTIEAIGKETYRVAEKEAIKPFGVTMNDATIHGFDQATGEAHHETEEKRGIKLFGVTLVAPIHGVA